VAAAKQCKPRTRAHGPRARACAISPADSCDNTRLFHQAGLTPAQYCKENPTTAGCKIENKTPKCDAVNCAEGNQHRCCATRQQLTLSQGVLSKAEQALAASSCASATTSATCKTLRAGLAQATAALAAAESGALEAEAKQATPANAVLNGTSAAGTTLPNVAATQQPPPTAAVVDLAVATAAKKLADQQFKDAGCVAEPDKEGCAALKKVQAAADAALGAAKDAEGSPAAGLASAAGLAAGGIASAVMF